MEMELKILALAEQMGITVEEDRVGWLAPGDLGGWFPTARLILLQPGLGWRNRLHTLAHELGHAHYGHPRGHYPKHEIQADVFAARLLISEQAYAEAERIFDGHPGAIADELGVTRSLLATWQAHHERTHNHD